MRNLWIQETINNLTGVIVMLLQVGAIIVIAALLVAVVYALIKTVVTDIAKLGKGGRRNE